MYNHVNKKNGEAAPLVSEEVYNIVMAVRGMLLCTRCGARVWRHYTCGSLTSLSDCHCNARRRMRRSWTATSSTTATSTTTTSASRCEPCLPSPQAHQVQMTPGRTCVTAARPAVVPLPQYDVAFAAAEDHAHQSLGLVCPLQTLERSYLLKVNGTVVERPQHMLMRVAVSNALVASWHARSPACREHDRADRRAAALRLRGSPCDAESLIEHPAVVLSWFAPRRCAERRVWVGSVMCELWTRAGGHPPRGPGRRHQDVPAAQRALVHARQPDAVQRRHAAPADVVLLPHLHEGAAGPADRLFDRQGTMSACEPRECTAGCALAGW